jgi:basic membrane protein A
VALVTDSAGVSDNGLNQLAYTGYENERQQFNYPEDVVQIANPAQNAEQLAMVAARVKLVIVSGASLQSSVAAVARAHPHTNFAVVDGCATARDGTCQSLRNVAALSFAGQRAGCLAGAVAGQLELDGPSRVHQLLGHTTISAIGSQPTPTVSAYLAGYKYCAQKVNPAVSVIIDYSQTALTPSVCHNLAIAQIEQHQADVILAAAGACGAGAIKAASQKGVLAIGSDVDQSALGANVVTSAVKHADTAVSMTIQAAESGHFSAKVPTALLSAGYTRPAASFPADLHKRADDFAQQLLARTLHLPSSLM